MSSATVVFIDIVDFSRNPNNQQRKLVDSLTTEVIYSLRPLMNPPMEKPHVMALPTGDGMALAFLDKPETPWNMSNIMDLICRIEQWANNEALALRIGVHSGPVEFITDINHKPNICGDTINFTQRVMDAANPRQVLFSDIAFRQYIGSKTFCYSDPPYSSERKAVFKGPFEVHAKHGMRMLVYKMTLDPPENWLSNEDPESKDLITVTLTTLPKEIIGSFSDRIRSAQEIGLIQLTGSRFLNEVKKGSITFSQELKRLLVFMPNPKLYEAMNLKKPFPVKETLEQFIQQWKDLFASIKSQHPYASLKLGLMEEPPSFGASFINWEKQGGKIHVSPYIPGTPADNCPGYDIEWVGQNASPVYSAYVAGLRYLDLGTAHIL